MVALGKRLLVESAGTAWLVFVGCGSIVLNVGTIQQAGGVLEAAVGVGLALATASYCVGRLSGGHFNPAVTVGFTVAQRFPVRDLLPYIASQILGAIVAAALLLYVAGGRPGFDLRASEFAANGFGEHSPADYQLHAALTIEFVLTFCFVMANLVVVRRHRTEPFAPLVVGACLAIVYLVSIPVTNGSVNPARSTAQALFVGDWALDQLWLFWAAPLLGGVAAGALFSLLHGKPEHVSVGLGNGRGEAV